VHKPKNNKIIINDFMIFGFKLILNKLNFNEQINPNVYCFLCLINFY
jgi:hypothetical protein